MPRRKTVALILAAFMLLALIAACAPEAPAAPAPEAPAPEAPAPEAPAEEAPAPAPEPPPPPPEEITQLPRDETLFIMGLQWGPSNGWNPFSNDMNNPLVHEQVGSGARLPMFETPFMYNPLDNNMVPLIAAGPYEWNEDRTTLTFTINPAAHWSDGTPITAHDFAFTWYVQVNYGLDGLAAFTPFIADIEAVGTDTVVMHAVTIDGVSANPLMMITYLGQQYVLQQAWLETLIERNNGDPTAMAADPGEDVVWSGPYGPFFRNDQFTAIIRDDNYWGQHPSMWGQLPVPRFIAHPIFADNAAGLAAFQAGEVDMSQMFIPNIHELWEVQGLPISTFIDEPPFGMTVNMPTAWFNMNVPLLAENVELRRAIAIAVDYDAVIANAMTNQSETFTQVPRSLMAPPAGEQAMYNQADVAHLQWAGNDIDGANQILDDAGFAMGDDGWRTAPNGDPIALVVAAPYGWSDWEAAMEIVAAAGEAIGIQMTTNFPDWSIYQTVVTAAFHDEYDIFMMWTDSTNPTMPWGRARQLLSSDFVGMESNWSGNWGHFVHERADELINLIPITADEDEVIAMFTELVEIYLTYVPSFSLMYRPDKFHAVNESVWTGFTYLGDGRNVPPMNAINGYGIADLYNIRLVG